MTPGKGISSNLYLLVLGLISIALLAYMLFPFLDVIIYGIFIYYVARPMYNKFYRRFKHKTVSAFISLFVVILPIVLISILYIEYCIYRTKYISYSDRIGGAVTFSLLNLVAPPQLMIPYAILLGILCGIGIFIPGIGVKLI